MASLKELQDYSAHKRVSILTDSLIGEWMLSNLISMKLYDYSRLMGVCEIHCKRKQCPELIRALQDNILGYIAMYV